MPLFPPPGPSLVAPLVFHVESNNDLHLRFNLDPLIVTTLGKIYLAMSIGKLNYKTGQINGGGGGGGGFTTSTDSTGDSGTSHNHTQTAFVANSGGASAGTPHVHTYADGESNATSNSTAAHSHGHNHTGSVGGASAASIAGYDVEVASTITNCKVFIDGVDRTGALGGPFANNTDFSAIDISAYVNTTGWHQVDVVANAGNGGIVAEIYAAVS